MPDNMGKSTQTSSSSSGNTHHTNVTGTPALSPTTLLNKSDLTANLAATTGPVKNITEAKAFLEQRSLIATNNNYNLESLAHLFITTSFKNKIPDKVTNIMRAIGLLLVGRHFNLITE